jgi:2-polyprenyl-6-methoxyphenol hydroxylase-like FAD-dependent oxidoreductase
VARYAAHYSKRAHEKIGNTTMEGTMKMNQKRRQGQRALVIGGSMAGLLAARVLSDHFEQVTILERDAVANQADARKGQPHVRHLHALLASGLEIYNDLFPGLNADLVAGGAILGDMGQSMRWYQFDGYRIQHNSGLTGALLSRPFLEWQVRRRVLALPNVRLLDECGVEGLQVTGDQTGVAGVRISRRQQGRQMDILQADLVVDASGRGSATPKWLATLGYPKPEEREVRVDVGYATRIYRRRPGDLTGAELLMVIGTPPQGKRGGMAFPIEDNRWIVTLAGIHGDHCPADDAAFNAFARSLPAPDLYNLIARLEPLSEIILHKFPASLRRHYEKLRRFPDGYLVMGDAICSFNPIYGQGMTSAAMQAQLLARLLAQGATVATLWRDFFKQCAHIIDIPWSLAVGEDFRYPETQGVKAPGTDLINSYVARVHQATHHDPVVYSQFLRVMNLMAPPTSLFKPQIMRRVLLQRTAAARTARLDPAIGD